MRLLPPLRLRQRQHQQRRKTVGRKSCGKGLLSCMTQCHGKQQKTSWYVSLPPGHSMAVGQQFIHVISMHADTHACLYVSSRPSPLSAHCAKCQSSREKRKKIYQQRSTSRSSTNNWQCVNRSLAMFVVKMCSHENFCPLVIAVGQRSAVGRRKAVAAGYCSFKVELLLVLT